MANPPGVVLTERYGTLATITLNRPELGNRVSQALINGIIQSCRRLADDSEVRVVSFLANGRDFSVGSDLADPETLRIAAAPVAERRRLLRAGPDMVRAIQELPQITVVAMHGHCLGAGGCIALACDLRVAASDLRFAMPEVLRGMNMSWHSLALMVEHFGPARTKELLVTNCSLDAEKSLAWGLANRVVEGGERQAKDAATRWASEISDGVPPVPASMVKQSINAIANSRTGMMHMDADQFILAQLTEDFVESITAFKEKRKPCYKGR